MEVGIGVAREGERCETGLLDRDAELFSDNSRMSVSSGRSPGSTLPPGNSQSPRAACLLGARSPARAVRIHEGDGDDEEKARAAHGAIAKVAVTEAVLSMVPASTGTGAAFTARLAMARIG